MASTNEELSAIYLISNHPQICNIIHNGFSDPVDSYWNGSHTWFDEPSKFHDIRFEYRLHPISGFKMPEASRPEELFELILEGKAEANHYLDGLEIFPIDDNELNIEDFKEYLIEALQVEPDFIGYVDHETIGNSFEQSNGDVSIIKLLCDQIRN